MLTATAFLELGVKYNFLHKPLSLAPAGGESSATEQAERDSDKHWEPSPAEPHLTKNHLPLPQRVTSSDKRKRRSGKLKRSSKKKSAGSTDVAVGKASKSSSKRGRSAGGNSVAKSPRPSSGFRFGVLPQPQTRPQTASSQHSQHSQLSSIASPSESKTPASAATGLSLQPPSASEEDKLDSLIEALDCTWSSLEALISAQIAQLNESGAFFPSTIAELRDKCADISQLIAQCKDGAAAAQLSPNVQAALMKVPNRSPQHAQQTETAKSKSLAVTATASEPERRAVFIGWSLLRAFLSRLVTALCSRAPGSLDCVHSL